MFLRQLCIIQLELTAAVPYVVKFLFFFLFFIARMRFHSIVPDYYLMMILKTINIKYKGISKVGQLSINLPESSQHWQATYVVHCGK